MNILHIFILNSSQMYMYEEIGRWGEEGGGYIGGGNGEIVTSGIGGREGG